MKLVGFLDHSELYPLVRTSIASLVPSIPCAGVIEATSYSALEALALDTPVVASDIGGLAEINSDSGLMLMFPAGDKQQLSAHLQKTYDQHDIRRDSLRSSYVAENFGAGIWGKKHLEIYKKSLRENYPAR